MHLGARADDWHSGNPDIRPGLWIAGFVGMVVIAIAIAALIGMLLNGDGSPYLS